MKERALPRRPIAALFVALFAMAVSLSFVFAILPPIGRSLGLSELQLGLIVAPAALVFVVANAAWGLVIDRTGRKPAILAATSAAALVTAAFGMIVERRLQAQLSVSTTFLLLCVLRVLLGALAGGFLPAAQACVADLTAPSQRTRGLAAIGTGFALGMVTGPGIAALFSAAGAAVPFYAVAGLAAAASVLVLMVLPEPRRNRPAPNTAAGRSAWGLLWPLLAIVGLVYTAYGVLLQVTGFRLQDAFDLSALAAAQHTGLALMLAAAGLVATQMLLARLRLPPAASRTTLRVGLLLALCAMATLGGSDAFALQLAGMALFGVGMGAVLPAVLGLLTLAADTAGDQGRVGGLSGAAQGLGMVLGPLAGAATYGVDRRAPYAIGLALLAVGLAVTRSARHPAPG
jgi:MFS family permease